MFLEKQINLWEWYPKNTEKLRKKLRGTYFLIFNIELNITINIFSVSVEPWNQVKKKRKIFNANTAAKKNKKGIIYTS